MFNKEPLFGKRDESARGDQRPGNTTQDLSGTTRGQGLAQPYGKRPEPAPAPAPAVPPRPVADAEESAGSKLIVGPDIKLKGVEITDCDTLVVEGRVEASMDSRVVQIAQHGIFSGKATMDVAEIWGTFEGQLTVRKHLVIYATGRVSGLIRYGKIRIEEGGELVGDISTLNAAQAVSAQATPASAQTTAPIAPTSFAGTQVKEPAQDALGRPIRQLGKTGATVP